MMSVSIASVVVLVFFYLLVLATGLLVTWWHRRRHPNDNRVETSLVAGRSLKGVVGALTMIATTVGGGYINGTAESIATGGLVWTLAPFGIFIGLNIGGLVYARRMRDKKYVTMLDPIQSVFGVVPTILVYIASLLGDLLWTAAILSALGSSLSVIAGIPLVYAVIVSAVVTVAYTLVGNMLAVAYTDILQLFLIALGLFMSLPFVLNDSRVSSISSDPQQWMGSVSSDNAVLWVDLLLAMSLGSIPWQAYFQRVLSVQTSNQAVVLSVVGAFGALLFAVPSVIIGAVATTANWTNTEYGRSPLSPNSSDASMVLPLVLREFTPSFVYPVALGAISAAVMSSMDSAILGSSAMFTHNIFHQLIRRKASDRQLMIVQRITVLCVGTVATAISLSVPLIYPIFILAADIVYVIVLPQLSCAIFIPGYCGKIGGVVGFVVGAVIRLGMGEPSIGLPCVWNAYASCELASQYVPFRTFAMLLSGSSIVLVSCVVSWVSKECREKIVRGVVGEDSDYQCTDSLKFDVNVPENTNFENTKFEVRKNSNFEIDENTYFDVENVSVNTNFEVDENTNVKVGEITKFQVDKTTNFDVGEITNFEIDENTNFDVEIDENTKFEVDENTNFDVGDENTKFVFDKNTKFDVDENTNFDNSKFEVGDKNLKFN